jgi:hypothetical protein
MSDDIQQSEGEVPITHRSVQAKTTEYIKSVDHSIDRVVEVHKLRHENPETYLTICERVQNNTYRGILTAIQNKRTATYDDIEDVTTVSRRSIRDAVTTLEDDGIVTKENSRLVTVKFASKDIEVLTSDALHMFFSNI